MEMFIYAKTAVDLSATNKTEQELTEEWTNFYYKYVLINRLTQNIANSTIIKLELNKSSIRGLSKGIYRDLKKLMLHISIEEASLSTSDELLESLDDKVDGFSGRLEPFDDAIVDAIYLGIKDIVPTHTYVVARLFASILEIGSYWTLLSPLVNNLSCRKRFKYGIFNTHCKNISDPYRIMRKLLYSIIERMPSKNRPPIDIAYHIYEMTIPDIPHLRDTVKSYVDAANEIIANENIPYEKSV